MTDRIRRMMALPGARPGPQGHLAPTPGVPAPRRAGGGLAGPLAALGLVALLPACAGWDNATANLADGIGNTGARMGAPWGSPDPTPRTQSTTIERVRFAALPTSQLQPESGDVWPGPLPPRATLANPDAALRGVPEYEPAGNRSLLGEPGSPAPRSSSGPPQRGVPGAQRGSSTRPPLDRDPFADIPRSAIAPPPAAAIAPPPPRADGRVIVTPQGPVVTSGGTDRVQTFNTPGGGSGTAVNQGNTTVLFGPDGRIQTVPNPPR